MNTDMIYLDHAAATPVDQQVIDAMHPYLSDLFFNPSSPYLPAVETRRKYEAAKDQIARYIGAKADEIIITAGATESINLAFLGVEGRIAVASVEHKAVIEAAKQKDFDLIASDPRGLVLPEAVRASIKPDTAVVSVSIANSELGTIQPISKISQIIKAERIKRQQNGNDLPIYLHCDASAGAGQLEVNVARLGVDMMTLNAAKIYGPKQVGLLWIAPHVKLKPLIVGGGQERGLRSGTENVAGVIGFAKAFELASNSRRSEVQRLTLLKNYMQEKLVNSFPEAVISGHPSKRLASHLHISFPGLDGERLVFALENRKVYVATGSACAANFGTRSHVLEAIDMPPSLADGSLRISLGKLSNSDNIEIGTEIIIDEIAREYERIKK